MYSYIFQQFGKILDVEIIFNERGSKVRNYSTDIETELKILPYDLLAKESL